MVSHRHEAGRVLLALGTAVVALTAPAAAQERRVDVAPYIGVDQSVLAGLKGSDEVLTYTNVYAGVNANISTQRVEAQADVRYEHSFGWGDEPDYSLVSGLANASYALVPDLLSLEAGALGTRTRTGGIGGGNGFALGDDSYSSQIYSAYAGPTLATRIGAFDVGAAYRLGYTHIDDGDDVRLPGGRSLSSKYESVYHSLSASIGQKPGVSLPVGWLLSAGYDREDTDTLDQRFEDKWARADVTLPVSPTLALVGGVGYEEVALRQRDVLRGPGGTPIITPDGQYATDTSSPRALIYDQDGLIWDVGVLWRPSPRTSLEARIGRRYGGTHYEGSFSWQPTANSSFGLVAYNSIESFGRLINNNVASLSGELNIPRNPFTGDLSGCAFSSTGGGQCFNAALSGTTSANFRNRGIAAQYTLRNGQWNWGAGLGYAERKFIDPGLGYFITADGTDEIFYATLTADRRLDDQSGITANLYANQYDGSDRLTNGGAYASYYRDVSRRLTATASLGVDGTKAADVETVITALGMIGMRYQF